jgi:thioredoxin reductase (NADPH)
MSVRKPPVPGIDSFIGASVYYGAAVTEARHYQGGRVLVVGGANSAGQGSVFLSRYASRVTLMKRGGSLEQGMSMYLVNQIRESKNIEVMLETELVAVHGNDRLESVTIRKGGTGETRELQADAMFIFVGAVPHSDIAAGIVDRTEEGFILTGSDLIRDGMRRRDWMSGRDPFLMETSVPGIFAAGDVRHNVVRRVASAVGQGAVAVSFIHKYLETV